MYVRESLAFFFFFFFWTMKDLMDDRCGWSIFCFKSHVRIEVVAQLVTEYHKFFGRKISARLFYSYFFLSFSLIIYLYNTITFYYSYTLIYVCRIIFELSYSFWNNLYILSASPSTFFISLNNCKQIKFRWSLNEKIDFACYPTPLLP